MGDRQAKDALFDAFGEVAKALGNGRRAELVDVLAQGERHVDDLAAEIGQSLANTSFHLRVLAAAGVVTTRREGTQDLLPTDLGHASANCGRPCATLPPPITSNSTNSLPPTWATVAGSSRSVRPNSPNESAPATSSSSTSDPPPSSPPDTSPEPDRSRSTNSPTTSGTFPPGSRSSPTAGARTACSPTTLFDFSADADALRDASRTATPNGSAPTCPPRRQPRRERAPAPTRALCTAPRGWFPGVGASRPASRHVGVLNVDGGRRRCTSLGPQPWRRLTGRHVHRRWRARVSSSRVDSDAVTS